MNLEKSSIVFSMNVHDGLRREREEKMGIKAVRSNPGTYLGIPFFWGRGEPNVRHLDMCWTK